MPGIHPKERIQQKIFYYHDFVAYIQNYNYAYCFMGVKHGYLTLGKEHILEWDAQRDTGSLFYMTTIICRLPLLLCPLRGWSVNRYTVT